MGQKERRKNRTDRLFEIILMLQSRRSLSSRDLAEHFGVSRRTIFRDLRALAESGVPLTFADEGGYEILEGYQLPPLMLTAREASTLLIGLEFMRLQSDPSLKANADHVEMKISTALPAEIKRYIEQLKSRTILDPYWLHAADEGGEEEGRWHELSQAVADRRVVSMEYFVASRGEVTKRTVNPLGIIYYTDHWNLIAFDQLRGEVRNFRFDRIRSMHVTMQRFQPPEAFDLEKYLREGFGARDQREIKIYFDAETYPHARRTVPASILDEQPRDEGAVITFNFDNLAYVARWLMRFGTKARVLEPPELRAAVKEEARSVASQY